MQQSEATYWKSLAGEARGDASNLKGTDYHLIYALWGLLTGEFSSVSFFAGNDLLATTAQPPSPKATNSLSSYAEISENDGKTDRWIQLKCTGADWTVSALLDDNLLTNFIINGFLSESRGREWKPELVTTSQIRVTALKEFIIKLKNQPKNRNKLLKIIHDTKQHLQKNASGYQVPRLTEIYKISIRVLEQFSICQTVHRAVLIAEIRSALTERLVDAPLVRSTFEQLYGALQHDAVNQNATPCSYDRDWLTRKSGCNFNDSGLLEQSVTKACDAQVQLKLPDKFNPDIVVTRSTLINLLTEFHSSSSTLFPLSGRSGTGKSYLLADWCNKLNGKPRLLIRAQYLRPDTTLASLVADELRNFTTQNLDDHLVLQKFASQNTLLSGIPVIVLDDIRPSVEHPIKFSKMIAQMVIDAKAMNIKIIISLQKDFEQNLKPFHTIDSGLFYSATNLIKSGRNVDTSPIELIDYSDEELVAILSTHTKNKDESDKLYELMQDPILSPLRNPGSLNVFLDYIHDVNLPISSIFQSLDLVKILDHPINLIKDQVSQSPGVSSNEVNEVINTVLKVLWDKHGQIVSKVELRQGVEAEVGSIAQEILPRLYERGLLNPDFPEHFSDRRIWSRCLARYAHSLDLSVDQIASHLDWKSDEDVVEQLVATASDPVLFSEELTCLSNEWVPGVCRGLVYSEPSDVRVLSLLVCISRNSEDERLVAGALGRFAIRSTVGRKWLLRQFVNVSADCRRTAETALYEIAKFVPKDVCKFVDFRFRLTHAPLEKYDKKWRITLLCGFRPLSGIKTKHGSEQASMVLSKVRELAEQPLGGNQQRNFDTIRTDNLLNEFDEINLKFAMKLHSEEYEEFLINLQSDDLLLRARAINSIGLITDSANQEINKGFLHRLAQEKNPDLLARVLWSSFQILRETPIPTLEALENQGKALWETYESAGAALSTLDILGSDFPERVKSILPVDWPAQDNIMFSILSELYVMCWIKCFRRSNELVEFRKEDCPALTWSGEEHLELYSLRAKLTALVLGLSDFGRSSENPNVFQTQLRESGQDFFQIDLSSWVASLEDKSFFMEEIDNIANLVIRATVSENNNKYDVLDKWNHETRLMISVDCIDILIELLQDKNKVADTVNQLPTEWQRLYCSSQLLSRGCREPELIELALDECENHEKSATPQGAHERSQCLIELQKIVPDRVPQIQQGRSEIGWFFSGGIDSGTRFISYIEEDLENFLPKLEQGINTSSNFMLLKDWHSTTCRWQTSLIAQAYSRMFEYRKITPRDAESMLEQMLIGLQGLPECEVRNEHIMLYQRILNRLQGTNKNTSPVRSEGGAIEASHRLAELILNSGKANWEWNDFLPYLQDTGGWSEDHHYRWNEFSDISAGSGQSHYVLFFFPAVRLAMIAVNGFNNHFDAGFEWMKRRREAELATKKYFGGNANRYKDSQIPIQHLTEISQRLPEQESIHSALGALLLKNDQVQSAEDSINRALNLPTCFGKYRGRVFYNLACCAARKDDFEQCKIYLLESESLGDLDKQWMMKDSDLKSVHEQKWFQKIANQ